MQEMAGKWARVMELPDFLVAKVAMADKMDQSVVVTKNEAEVNTTFKSEAQQ